MPSKEGEGIKFLIILIAFILILINLFQKPPVMVKQIYVFPDVLDTLNQDYQVSFVAGKENAYCMMGTIGENEINIKRLVRPMAFNSTLDGITIEGCEDKKFIGMIHYHIGKQPICGLSKTDITSSERIDLTLSGVMCGTNHIAFFISPNFETEYPWVVGKGPSERGP